MTAAPDNVAIRRARIEEVRPLALEYRDETAAESDDGLPWDPPLPQGAVFWLAEDRESREPLGYAAGTLRPPTGMTIGPLFVRRSARRRGVGFALLRVIQTWAEDTRVPVVEISIAADNHDGRAFLESTGYVPRRVLFSLTPVTGRRDRTAANDDPKA